MSCISLQVVLHSHVDKRSILLPTSSTAVLVTLILYSIHCLILRRHHGILTVLVSFTGCATGHSTMAAPRLLCVLGTDAAAEVIEEFVSPATDFSTPHVTNALAEMELAQGARLKHG